MRVCSTPGCGTLILKGARGGRCPEHRRAVDAQRGRRQERGYGADHDRRRASFQRDMDAGSAYVCWRCGKPINPASWQLGHCDDSKDRYHGPECVGCNTATSARRDADCPHASHSLG